MSTLPILSLSNALLVEVISSPCSNDLFACWGTCRRLNDLIFDLHLMNTSSAAPSRVCTVPSVMAFPCPSLVALEQWETAWQEIDLRQSSAHIDAPTIPKGRGQQVEFSFARYIVVVIREGYGRSAGYSLLDMHATFSSLHTNVTRWTTIKINPPNALVFAFASELDFAAAISALDMPDRRRTTLEICPMWFSTGKPHPLAP